MKLSHCSNGVHSLSCWFIFLARYSALLLVAFAPIAALQAQSNYATPYAFTTLAGATPSRGFADGTGSASRFISPFGVAVDGAGNLYVADTGNNAIRKITAAGVVTTLSGAADEIGSTDGTGSLAQFAAPCGVAVDGSGNVYVADTDNHTIRKITSAGVVTTLAGLPESSGANDGTGSAARFQFPRGVTVDGSGNVFVADSANNTIRKITSAGVVTTMAGSAGVPGSTDGTGSAALFAYPEGVVVDGSGNLYVADTGNHTIRKITAAGVVTTFAGNAGIGGSSDGTGNAARLGAPAGVGIDGAGNLYVSNNSSHTIRMITSGGVVTTLAGSVNNSGAADGTGAAALFYQPAGVAVGVSGNIYVADQGNNTIRQITSAGVVTTFAGDTTSPGSIDGTGVAARFYGPNALAVDGSGNVYIADAYNSTIRKVTSAGVVSTLAGTAGASGYLNDTGSSARFNWPSGMAVDGAGNVYVADSGNNVIRKLTSAGVVSTFAGASDGSVGSTDGTGSGARFSGPSGVAVDATGNIYVADAGNSIVRKITAAGVVTTLAGSAGNPGSADGMGSNAQFGGLSGVAVDGAGNVYVSDTSNFTIRKITAAGVVATLAGLAGDAGSTDGTGNAARFDSPVGIAVDGAGNVYVTDESDSIIRKITLAGVVTTIAGRAGYYGSADGVGIAVRFDRPYGVAVDGTGNVYVADTYNNTIRKGAQDGLVAPSNAIITITVE